MLLQVIDPIVKQLLKKFEKRENIGLLKYGKGLNDNNKDNYLNHLQEELMDASLYIEKLQQQQLDITQLVKQYSNDQELGNVIRLKYG